MISMEEKKSIQIALRAIFSGNEKKIAQPKKRIQLSVSA